MTADPGPDREGFTIGWPGRGTVAPEREATAVTSCRWSDPAGALVTGDLADLPALSDVLAAHDLDPVGWAQLVYLDPPYNRGGRFAGYDDNLPRIHWLDAIERRLRVARELLATSGTVWVHLDDAEAHRVRCLLDEVFGTAAFVADLTVESNPKGRQLDRHFAGSHDRLMVYARDPARVRLRGGVAETVTAADFPLVGADGTRFRLLPLRNTNKRFTPAATPSMAYPLYGDPTTGRVRLEPGPGLTEIHPVFGDLSPAVWRWSRSRAAERLEHLVCRTVRGKLGPRVDVYQRDVHFDGRTKKLKTIWLAEEVGSTDTARADLRRAGVEGFRTPKPLPLLRRIVDLATDPGELVVDGYAGSGTTAVAAHELGRRCVSVEINPDTVREVTVPRLRAAGISLTPGC